MIKIIGFQRLFLILVLIAACCGIYYYNSSVLSKQVVEVDGQFSSVQAEISSLQAELEKMKTDAEFFETRRNLYEKISGTGFFKTQDRVQARQRFDVIQKLSKIVSAKYEIKAASIMAQAKPNAFDEDGESSAVAVNNFSIIESPVQITLSAIDDLDIYRFIYYLNYGFPGHITITKVFVKKVTEVTPDILKNIGLANPPELVTANIELVWRSMIPKNVMETSNDLKTLSQGVSE